MYTINGCNGQTAQRQIHVEEPAKFGGFDIQKIGGTQFSLDYKTSKATQSQVWTIESGDTSSDRPFLLEIFTTGVQHINLLMRDMNGCELSADTLFLFNPDAFFYIPNAFTPNSDVLNENFRPVVNDYDWYLKVYSRTGQLVFDGKMNQAWDGNVSGVRATTTVFYFYIRFVKDGEQKEVRGSVQVLY